MPCAGLARKCRLAIDVPGQRNGVPLSSLPMQRRNKCNANAARPVIMLALSLSAGALSASAQASRAPDNTPVITAVSRAANSNQITVNWHYVGETFCVWPPDFYQVRPASTRCDGRREKGQRLKTNRPGSRQAPRMPAGPSMAATQAAYTGSSSRLAAPAHLAHRIALDGRGWPTTSRTGRRCAVAVSCGATLFPATRFV